MRGVSEMRLRKEASLREMRVESDLWLRLKLCEEEDDAMIIQIAK